MGARSGASDNDAHPLRLRRQPRRISEGERAGYSHFLEDTPLPDPLARRKPAPGEGWHHRISVRFSDVDVYAHVNNVHYLEYLQEARVAIIGEVWAGASTLPHLVVRRTEVDYVRPLLLRGDPYDVRSWISRVGGSSFVLVERSSTGRRSTRSHASSSSISTRFPAHPRH